MRRLGPAEGQRLQRIALRVQSRTGGNEVRWRNAVSLLALAGENSVLVIACPVAADEDRRPEVIHCLNKIWLDCLGSIGSEAVPACPAAP